MAESAEFDGGPSAGREPSIAGDRARDRLRSFRVMYAAIFAFVALSVLSILGAEGLLTRHFRSAVEGAIRVSPANGAIVPQIRQRVRGIVQDSAWVRFAGVKVNAIIMGADGTILYSGGGSPSTPFTSDPIEVFREAQRVLPASAETFIALPINSILGIGILIGYGTILISGLFVQHRNITRRDFAILRSAIEARNLTAQRAGSIERELEQVRQRLLEVEPTERGHAEEIRELQTERATLQRKLTELGEREQKLRASADRSIELEEEHRALEELLEEAVDDLGHKDEEIHSLQGQLKQAAKAAPTGGRARGTDQLARRLRTLYKSLEFDDRAVSDMVALGDETMRLKAEEAIKRLAEDSENAAVRRKVGGLPPQLSIFELGFAGKGRVYYSRGAQQRFRILAVGAKNTQKTDLDYLSRLPIR